MNQQGPNASTGLLPDRGWALFLDVDGTLLHVAETPDAVEAGDQLCRLLSRLMAVLDGALALVSGRSIENLDQLFAPLRLPAAGLHGLQHRNGDGRLRQLGEADALDHLRPPLRELAAGHDGLLLEDKGRALALHYRLAPDQGPDALRRVQALVAAEPDLLLIHGKMVIEVKPRHADKGSAIESFMAEPPFHGRHPVFLGDDVTDEDGFLAVNRMGGHTVHVGNSDRTAAGYSLADVDQVHAWLIQVADALAAQHRGRPN